MPEKKPRKKRAAPPPSSAEFYSDMLPDGLLYAALARAPCAGTVTSITTPDMPDDYYFFTARNVPGKNTVETAAGPIPLLSEGRAMYDGEPVGIVVGPSQGMARQFARDVTITVEPDAAPYESTVIASRHFEDGPCFAPGTDGTIPGLDGVFQGAQAVVQGTWTYGSQATDAREPNGALCDLKDGTLTVYTQAQWYSVMRTMLSQATALDAQSIVIRKTKTPACFTNGIWYNPVLASHAAVASCLTGHPVLLMLTRAEQKRFMQSMHGITIAHKSALNADGTIAAMQVDIRFDAGAYNPLATEITDRLAIAACGCYAAQNVSVTARAHTSCRQPASLDFHTMDAAAFFAAENQMNLLCAKSRLTPLEFRCANMTAAKRTRFVLPLEKTHQATEALARAGDFNRKFAAYSLESETRRLTPGAVAPGGAAVPLRGIGIACAYEGAGYLGSGIYSADQELSVTKEKDGSLSIHSPQVSETIRAIWADMAAATTGTPRQAVRIAPSADETDGNVLPENAYSSISILTQLLGRCLEAIKKQGDKATLPLTVRRRTTPAERRAWDKAQFCGKPFFSTSFAAATLELELDPCTLTPVIRQIQVVINGGRLLNSRAAESTARLALSKSLSLLARNNALSCAKTQISFVKSDENPAQIGNLIYRVIPAAYTQALSQALGCTVTDVPVQAQTLLEKFGTMEKGLDSDDDEQAVDAAQDTGAEQ